MDAYSVDVAAKVAGAMEAAGATRDGLANQTGIPRTTLRRCLDGHRPFNTDELASIALALDVDVIDLVKPVAA